MRLCYRAGFKQYALSNHLGNVLATVSDRVILEDTTGDDTADAHLADLLSAQDYYPFGMRMPGRAGQFVFGYHDPKHYFSVGSGGLFDLCEDGNEVSVRV